MGRGVSTTKPVAKWLAKHVGETIHLTDIYADFPALNQDTIRKALSTELPSKGFIIEPIVRGSVYRFKGYEKEQDSSGKLFEQIGVAKDGRLVLQCDDRTIYLATEVG